MADTFSVQMNNILNEYDKEVQETVNSSIDTISRETVQRLKNNSPKRTGVYARGWTRRKDSGGRVVSYIVYNSTKPQITHLLENGHLVRNKFGTYGRTNGNGKIREAEQWANMELESLIERKL